MKNMIQFVKISENIIEYIQTALNLLTMPLDSQTIDILTTMDNSLIKNPLVDLIQKLYKTRVDVIDLHFKYAVSGEGYNQAKNDFNNRLQE